MFRRVASVTQRRCSSQSPRRRIAAAAAPGPRPATRRAAAAHPSPPPRTWCTAGPCARRYGTVQQGCQSLCRSAGGRVPAPATSRRSHELLAVCLEARVQHQPVDRAPQLAHLRGRHSCQCVRRPANMPGGPVAGGAQDRAASGRSRLDVYSLKLCSGERRQCAWQRAAM